MHTPVILRAVTACMLLFVLPAAGYTTAGSGTSRWNDFLSRHVHAGTVDYTAATHDSLLARAIEQFAANDPASITATADRLAFWINAYNAFTIKLITDHFPVKSIKDISAKPWDDPFVEIHGVKYSLNKIEHDILRKQFSEPRIHFALVCAAKGCPPLRNEAYAGKTLEQQLADNTKIFLRDTSKNIFHPKNNALMLSPIFDWYKTDFSTKSGSVQQFVKPYFGDAAITAQTTVTFSPYDWSLNGH